MGWWKATPAEDKTEQRPPAYPGSSTQSPPPKESPSACPVDHKSRSIWLQQAQKPIAPHPISPASDATECPVDPKTREIWLKQARSKAQLPSSIDGAVPEPQKTTQKRDPKLPTGRTNPLVDNAASKECSSDSISQSPTIEPATIYPTKRALSLDREVSSIPRAQPGVPATKLPSNAESETGQDKKSGNWIYPSESQFFNAVMRKQTASDPAMLAQSISSIIPIHNAVNERAWHLIRAWEGDSSARCGGPKLLSFHGLGAGALTPRAKMKSWMGYAEPFDRHDWTVERCGGETVEYVIDFYQGKAPENIRSVANLNFYLDVRPKLNSVEGCRMRFERFVGWR